jgi:hypothetical protein
LYKARTPSLRTVERKQSKGPLNRPSAEPDVCIRTLIVSTMKRRISHILPKAALEETNVGGDVTLPNG